MNPLRAPRKAASGTAAPDIAVPFVDTAAQQRSIAAQLSAAIEGVLASSKFVLGPQVAEFERAFAEFVGVRHAVGTSSGLDALRLALTALDIGQGDQVILPANTYIATALAVSAVGARPVLVDCDPRTYQLAVDQIGPAVTTRTRAIIPVHLTGQAADMDPVCDVARANGLHVIEDAAQAHGAKYKGRSCGKLGTIGCFSFYPSKNLGALGDAGMLTTGDSDLAERLRRLRNYGQQARYQHVEKGINARLDTLQAAVLSVKLRHLARWNEARARHAEVYRRLLAGVGDLVFQENAAWSSHVYHLFVIETGHRDALREHLAAAGVQTGVHYPVPIHLQPAYADLGHKQGDFPQAERLAGRMLSLPMFPELRPAQIAMVADEVRRFFAAPGLAVRRGRK
ncbi:MAG TPA: DegT/DnrJ/EryC1/StrS family aminotransferase [Actinomycetota bacterium]|nr:DegT/DnrJ/EryC1/StrS family aminotransferase [Actinomycetota bacterium]